MNLLRNFLVVYTGAVCVLVCLTKQLHFHSLTPMVTLWK